MKMRHLFVCGLALCIAGLVWQTTRRQPGAASTTPPDTRATPPPRAALVSSTGNEPQPDPHRPRRPPAGHGEAVMEAIQTATATHDVRMIPLLARYLESDAAEVRAAALQGLIELGERDAIPYLKIAVKRPKSRRRKSNW